MATTQPSPARRSDQHTILLTFSHSGRVQDEAFRGTMLETARACGLAESRLAWSGV
jgi:hypothetical protein